jgi:hypothetical protein
MVAGILALLPTKGHAQLSVERGWDLWITAGGSSFPGLGPLVGVPYGTFDFTTGTDGDFGRGIGVKAVGDTDTIIKRRAIASVPGPPGALPQTAAPIPIEMVGLQLRSAAPVNIGAGLDFHYITLQSARGGPVSPGSMSITFSDVTGGTFSSFFDVFFDIRIGSLTGPILVSDTLPLSSSASPWGHEPLPGELLIDDVNNVLNNVDRLADFHPRTATETHPNGAVHTVQPVAASTAAPEPGTMGLLAFGLLIGIARRRRA